MTSIYSAKPLCLAPGGEFRSCDAEEDILESETGGGGRFKRHYLLAKSVEREGGSREDDLAELGILHWCVLIRTIIPDTTGIHKACLQRSVRERALIEQHRPWRNLDRFLRELAVEDQRRVVQLLQEGSDVEAHNR